MPLIETTSSQRLLKAAARIERIEQLDRKYFDEAVGLVRAAVGTSHNKEKVTSDLFSAAYGRAYWQLYGRDLNCPINLRYFVALNAAEEIIGLCGLYESIGNLALASWLGWICVRPDLQKNGIGAALVQFCIDRARKEGVRVLRSETSNNGITLAVERLLERMGFEVTCCEPSAIDESIELVYRQLKVS